MSSPASSILLLYYSQTGQTKAVMEAMAARLEGDGNKVESILIESVREFPLPWRFLDFFHIMPECLRGNGVPTKSLTPEDRELIRLSDLVIFGFQPWFLSPSLPIQGFLQSADSVVLKEKSVLTTVVCRSRWYTAAREVNLRLFGRGGIGAHQVGQIVLREARASLITLLTTPLRLMSRRMLSTASFVPEVIDTLGGFPAHLMIAPEAVRGAGVDYLVEKPYLTWLLALGRLHLNPVLADAGWDYLIRWAYAPWACLIRLTGGKEYFVGRLVLMAFSMYILLIAPPITIFARALRGLVLSPHTVNVWKKQFGLWVKNACRPV